MIVHEDIELALEKAAGIYAVAEGNGNVITLSGLIRSEKERQTAFEIVSSLAPGKRIVDNLEVLTAVTA